MQDVLLWGGTYALSLTSVALTLFIAIKQAQETRQIREILRDVHDLMQAQQLPLSLDDAAQRAVAAPTESASCGTDATEIDPSPRESRGPTVQIPGQR